MNSKEVELLEDKFVYAERLINESSELSEEKKKELIKKLYEKYDMFVEKNADHKLINTETSISEKLDELSKKISDISSLIVSFENSSSFTLCVFPLLLSLLDKEILNEHLQVYSYLNIFISDIMHPVLQSE